MTGFEWATSGDADWNVSTETPYEGTYCIKSGTISDDQSTLITLDYKVMSDDSISFFRKVSSEADYDYLKFYIDGTEMGKWAGEVDWSRVVYSVTAGEHTFQWEYTKDVSQSGGTDAAYIDFIILPPALTTTAYAGADGTVCEGNIYQCNANATNYASVLWTTSGTGTFSDVTLLNPEYTLSQADIDAGQVTLTFTAYGADKSDATDQIILTLNKNAVAFAGDDFTVCENETVSITNSSAVNYTALNWTTSGTGTFDDVTLLNPVYIPSAEDYLAGNVTLNLTVTGIAPCGDVADGTVVTFTLLPDTPEIPTSASNRICQDAPDTEVTTTGSSNAIDYTWSIEPVEAGIITGTTTQASINWNPDFFGAANITVKALNTCGESDYSSALAITLVPFPLAPEKPMGSDSVDVFITTSSDFRVNKAMHALTYTWNIEPVAAGTIAGNDTIATITWSNSFTGTANISVKSVNSCGESVFSEIKTVTLYSTYGIPQNIPSNTIAVYPNPSNGNFVIGLKGVASHTVDIRIANETGVNVYKQNNISTQEQNILTMQLQSLSNGVYYLFVEGKNYRSVQKLIISR
jgi:hypothetical protein